MKDWINFGIHWKNLLSHFGLSLGLWSVALASHVFGFGLDTYGLVNIPDDHGLHACIKEKGGYFEQQSALCNFDYHVYVVFICI